MRAKEVTLSPRRRALERNRFVTLGATEIGSQEPEIPERFGGIKKKTDPLSKYRFLVRRRRVLSIVFRFLGQSLSLQPPEHFLFCLPVGHSHLHEGKDELIHELIDLCEPPGDFLLFHSR